MSSMDKKTQARLEQKLRELICHTIPVVVDDRMFTLYRSLCGKYGLAPDRQAARFIGAWVNDELKQRLLGQGIICLDSVAAETVLPTIYRYLHEELALEVAAGLARHDELEAFEAGERTIVPMPSENNIGYRVARSPEEASVRPAWLYITWQDLLNTANADWLLSWVKR